MIYELSELWFLYISTLSNVRADLIPSWPRNTPVLMILELPVVVTSPTATSMERLPCIVPHSCQLRRESKVPPLLHVLPVATTVVAVRNLKENRLA